MEAKARVMWSVVVTCLLFQGVTSVPLREEGGRSLMSHFGSRMREIFGSQRVTSVTCDACKLGLEALSVFIAENATNEEIIDEVTTLCVTLGIEPEGVCRGMLEEAVPEVMYVFTHSDFNSSNFDNICGFMFMGDCVIVDEFLQEYDWTVSFPSPEPPYVPPPQPAPDSPTLRVLHISDIHLDPSYSVGSVSNCDEPLCCRTWSRTPDLNVTYSGVWGAYDAACDLPQATLENLLQFISENVEFDVIYWTGDIPPHDVYNQTKDGNLAVNRQVADIIKSYIPEPIVYPAVGNHEAEPVNSFPVPAVYDDWDISYLYNQLDDSWKGMVPDLTDDTVLKGAYYASQIRPGLRLISLNMNYCHGGNWWLLVESQDPTEELQWLIAQLDDAETNGEKAHIIGHIPPGECTYVWSRNFRDIVDRYKMTISGTFFGHTHNDEFEIMYDDVNTSIPFHVANVGPSATTYSHVNPSFRVYTVDGDYDGSSYAVLDYDVYYMDVARANEEGTPTWEILYSALDSYGLSAYTPEEWNNFVSRMETDDDLFQLFYNHYNRRTDQDPCEGSCKQDKLCRLRRGWSGYEDPNC